METATKTPTQTTPETTLQVRVLAGVAGGLVGGMMFGAMMQMMDMMGMVAMLVGSESLFVGWAAHLAISAAFGVGFGLIMVKGLDSWATGIGAGIAYGAAWWVLGALLLMPAKLGMPVFVFTTMAWQSLMGHLIFGMVLGAVSVAIVRGNLRD